MTKKIVSAVLWTVVVLVTIYFCLAVAYLAGPTAGRLQ